MPRAEQRQEKKRERGEDAIWRMVASVPKIDMSVHVSAEDEFWAGEAKNEVRRHEVLPMQ